LCVSEQGIERAFVSRLGDDQPVQLCPACGAPVDALSRIIRVASEPILAEIVVALLRRLFPGAAIQEGVSYQGFRVDIQVIPELASEGLILVECKALEVAGTPEIEGLAAYKRLLQRRVPLRRFIFAVSGQLTAAAQAKAQEQGIEVWDGLAIAALVSSPPGTSPDPATVGEARASVQQRRGTSERERAHSLNVALGELAPGQDLWPAYQELCRDVIQFLFCPPLAIRGYESSDAAGRNRRDIILENPAETGFWRDVRVFYAAHYIVVDAKNYSKPLGKDSVIELAHYLKPYGCGLFGVLFSRQGPGKPANHAIREQWIGGSKMILVLSDADVSLMLGWRTEGLDPSEFLRLRIAEFRMSL
jgi:hypothetical protein